MMVGMRSGRPDPIGVHEGHETLKCRPTVVKSLLQRGAKKAGFAVQCEPYLSETGKGSRL